MICDYDAVLCICNAGVFLISLALCADAVIGNVQEKTIKHFNAPNAEVVRICCFISDCGTFCLLKNYSTVDGCHNCCLVVAGMLIIVR